MTLKEKIHKIIKHHTGLYKSNLTKEISELADDYAIEFADWIGKNTIAYNDGKFRMKTLKPVLLTSEELLERFKKEL